MALDFLFKWNGRNITLNQKIAAYAHLYSYTSVKSVVHWFQIIRNGCFQMFDDDPQRGLATTFTSRTFTKVAKFPTRNITTPIVLLYGGCDSLVDIDVMLKELPSHTTAHKIPHYEHLDFLWGENIQNLVFPRVLSALDRFSDVNLDGFESISIPLLSNNRPRMTEEELKAVEASLEAQVQQRLAALSAHLSDDETLVDARPASSYHTADEPAPRYRKVALAASTSAATQTPRTVPKVDQPASPMYTATDVSHAGSMKKHSRRKVVTEPVPEEHLLHANSLVGGQPLYVHEGSLTDGESTGSEGWADAH